MKKLREVIDVRKSVADEIDDLYEELGGEGGGA
jgi:hypothetical protein